MNALFVGGYISAGQLLNPAWTSGAAQVGRLELTNNTWVWSKVIVRKTDIGSKFKIKSLAVDRQGMRVAAFGMKGDDNKYLFLLNAATGEIESDLLEIRSSFTCKHHAPFMLLQSDGTVLLTMASEDETEE